MRILYAIALLLPLVGAVSAARLAEGWALGVVGVLLLVSLAWVGGWTRRRLPGGLWRNGCCVLLLAFLGVAAASLRGAGLRHLAVTGGLFLAPMAVYALFVTRALLRLSRREEGEPRLHASDYVLLNGGLFLAASVGVVQGFELAAATERDWAGALALVLAPGAVASIWALCLKLLEGSEGREASSWPALALPLALAGFLAWPLGETGLAYWRLERVEGLVAEGRLSAAEATLAGLEGRRPGGGWPGGAGRLEALEKSVGALRSEPMRQARLLGDWLAARAAGDAGLNKAERELLLRYLEHAAEGEAGRVTRAVGEDLALHEWEAVQGFLEGRRPESGEWLGALLRAGESLPAWDAYGWSGWRVPVEGMAAGAGGAGDASDWRARYLRALGALEEGDEASADALLRGLLTERPGQSNAIVLRERWALGEGDLREVARLRERERRLEARDFSGAIGADGELEGAAWTGLELRPGYWEIELELLCEARRPPWPELRVLASGESEPLFRATLSDAAPRRVLLQLQAFEEGHQRLLLVLDPPGGGLRLLGVTLRQLPAGEGY